MSDHILDYDQALESFEPVLGLEVHVELSTQSKMFCGCSAAFGAAPNTNVCPVCLGLPGAMPAINGKAVESAIRMGLALNCQIAEWSRMSRKNYFYPDMSKDYQTSQHDEPIAHDGWVDVELSDGEVFRVPIERAHMEEDAGKLNHVGGSTGRLVGAQYSLIDYNRAGVPLIEIVTKPIIGAGERAPEVAAAYVETIRDLMRALGVSNVRMNEGSLRCDANVSLRPWGRERLGTRTETKNINSLRSVEAAVRYEIQRQAAVLSEGGTVEQCTRNWREDVGETSFGRSKEEAEDYRYFPEPDLMPIAPAREWVEQLRATLPEPPTQRRRRLQQEWGFSDLEMRDIVAGEVLDQIEATVAAGATAQGARKWWTGDLSRRANEAGLAVEELAVSPADVAQVQKLVDAGTINDKLARQVFDGVLAGEGTPEQIVADRGLAVVSDDGALSAAVDKAIEANPEVAESIRGGRVQAAGALIGAVMKEMRGQADAARVREIILEKLTS